MTEKTTVMLLEQLDINQLLGTPTPSPAVTDSIGSISGESSGYNSFWQLAGLVLMLIIILIAAYYTSRIVGGIKLGQLRRSNFQVIDSYRITPNKTLQIVKIGNKYIVIAIGKDDVNYITELDESEVILKEFHQGEKQGLEQSFKQILDKLKNNKDAKADNHEDT